MKPGMQRDLLVAFWFLFDEFEIGNGTDPEEGGIPDDPDEPKKTRTASRVRSQARSTDRQSR